MISVFIRLLDHCAARPLKGFITWAAGYVLSFAPDGMYTSVKAIEMEVILFYFQVVSLGIGSVAGLLTIISLVRKLRKKS